VKLETEFIKISMVDLPLGTTENCVCLFGGFTQTICCTCATTAVVAMTTTNEVTTVVAAVMVMRKVRMIVTALIALVTVAMVARTPAVTAAAMANLLLQPNCYNPPSTSIAIIVTVT
jgi:hypothetical protein